MTNYDKYYKTEDLFGKPYPELIDFFQSYEFKGKLIDLGCGQGRNSIPLARMGYDVTGIDSSETGIVQMMEKSDYENLKISGIVGDIYQYEGYHNFDIVLLDSIFHFEKKDLEKETRLIKRIATQIESKGLICIYIQDTGSKVRILKQTLADTELEFEILADSSLIYIYHDNESDHKSETKYCNYTVRKK